jgi:hypothetical protein
MKREREREERKERLTQVWIKLVSIIASYPFVLFIVSFNLAVDVVVVISSLIQTFDANINADCMNWVNSLIFSFVK